MNDAGLASVLAGITSLNAVSPKNSWLTLTNYSADDELLGFAQTAATPDGFVVEIRIELPESSNRGFWKAGRKEPPARAVSQSKEGRFKTFANEVLSVEEVKAIFDHFYQQFHLHPGFTWRSMLDDLPENVSFIGSFVPGVVMKITPQKFDPNLDLGEDWRSIWHSGLDTYPRPLSVAHRVFVQSTAASCERAVEKFLRLTAQSPSLDQREASFELMLLTWNQRSIVLRAEDFAKRHDVSKKCAGWLHVLDQAPQLNEGVLHRCCCE